ncbi:MAG TPA: iron-containing redox enzyme family protein [Mycobacterium sp.]|nr:iron-containing redox enzyme family protein [Mycobacterium sp.]
MKTANPYAGLKDRDYFHIMLNLDSFDGFQPTARSLAEGYLKAARRLQKSPGMEAELRPFAYTKQALEARLDQIYQGLADDVAHYEADQSWSLRTKDDVLDWILQMAPFNQTDGAWLRMIAEVGPMDDVQSLLFTIYTDELGGGNPELNHANVYTKLLHSAGFDLPNIRSRAYVDNANLVDAAFTLPLFQLVVSQFSQDYFPELLGMTLYLEWSSVELKNMVLLNRHFGLDTQFYELHVAIDNASTGHGAMALRAIELYLEQVRIDAGDDAVQEQWSRIWDGYVAFATTGELAKEVAERREKPSSPADKVAAMIADRAPKARLNHGTKHLGDALLNELFDDPPALMAALVDGGMVTPGEPEHSVFFELTAPTGPMFRIFSEPELETWRAWIRSLGSSARQARKPLPRTIAEQMADLVDTMRPRQHSAAAHKGAKLVGDDPESQGHLRKEPVSWWFEQSASVLMAALAHPENNWILLGDAASSRFITDIARGKNAMARALNAETPDGATGVSVIEQWIDARCPLPDAPSTVRPITLLSPPERVAAHPSGQIHGAGSVH